MEVIRFLMGSWWLQQISQSTLGWGASPPVATLWGDGVSLGICASQRAGEAQRK